MPESLEGYVQLYSHEQWGAGFLGLKVFVKMSRPVDSEVDRISAEVNQILHKLQHNTAMKDPELPERQRRMRDELLSLFPSPVYAKQIPNQYCSQPCCYGRPWFEVTTSVGLFVVGWRKSVLVVDWSGTDVTLLADKLFPDEAVTKIGRLIHAWSYDKAREYIEKIHQAAPAGNVAADAAGTQP